ncbi:atp-dependent dna helicase q-like sim [Quercus suber]|uniref:DNA 3'-5' helicase n=1 Tax=Quercus suber TaxID=58331 RepID=A0AAW0J0D8_QUESU
MDGNGLSFDEVIAKLIEMGFQNSSVLEAVKAVGPSFDDALEYLSNYSHRNSRGQLRQLSILDHFQSTARPKKRRTGFLPDALVPVEEHKEDLSGMHCNLETMSELFPVDCPWELDIASDWEKKVVSLLQKHFRYSSLKNFQKEALAAWLAHQDCLVLAATGSGKSLCFQIPALLTGKVVVVISPLISLMHDQCLKLAKHGVSACFLGSGQPDSTVEQKAMRGMYSIVYVCPETVLRRLSVLRENFSACNLKFLKYDIPLMALTATATIRVREDILKSLCMSKETKIVITSFFRPNLRFSVKHSRTSSLASYAKDFSELIDIYVRKRKNGEKKQTIISEELDDSSYGSDSYEIEDSYTGGDVDEVDSTEENGLTASKGKEMSVEYLENDVDVFQSVDDWDVAFGEFCGQSSWEEGDMRGISETIDPPSKPEERLRLLHEPLEQGPTIIYVPTRKETLKIAKFLCGFGVKAAAYNASVVVATIAFGMGIDKSNVRRIIHYGWPQSLEAYYQEAGRAGRDGKLADCTLYANLTHVPSLLPSKRSEDQTKQAYKMLSDCFRYGMNTSCCRAKILVEYFGEDFSYDACLLCDLCTDGVPQMQNLKEEADLLVRVIATNCGSTFMDDSYDDTTCTDIKQRRSMEMLNLRAYVSKIRELCQKFVTTDLLWWRGLARILEIKGYIQEADDKPTKLGLEFLRSKGDETFDVYPEADMLLSMNKCTSYSTFTEWGKGWADPEIRRQRLERMRQKPDGSRGKQKQRKSRGQESHG